MGLAQLGEDLADAAVVLVRVAGGGVGEGDAQVGAGELAVDGVERGPGDVVEDVGPRPLAGEGLAALFGQRLADALEQCLESGHGRASGPEVRARPGLW